MSVVVLEREKGATLFCEQEVVFSGGYRPRCRFVHCPAVVGKVEVVVARGRYKLDGRTRVMDKSPKSSARFS